MSRQRGYVIALSLTRDARKEGARARVVKGLDIDLALVENLLESEEERGPLMPKDATVARHAAHAGEGSPTADELIASATA